MIEILMVMLNCSYSDAYSIIIRSKTYYWLKEKDFATCYDSPQANLDDIGRELREVGNKLGQTLTDENIVKTMYYLIEQNLKEKQRLQEK